MRYSILNVLYYEQRKKSVQMTELQEKLLLKTELIISKFNKLVTNYNN